MVSKNIPSQRALVLQGGGSIGAYEAGVFNVLYYWIRKDLQDKNEKYIRYNSRNIYWRNQWRNTSKLCSRE